MSKLFSLLVSILLFSLSCTNITNKNNEAQGNSQNETITNQSLEIGNSSGANELQKYLDYEFDFKEYHPFNANARFFVYPILCSGHCDVPHSVFNSRAAKGIEINGNQYAQFLKIMNDPSSYGGTQAACFDPKLSIICYNEEGTPIELYSICMDCNSFLSFPLNFKYPSNISSFSVHGKEDLIGLFASWKIQYYPDYYEDLNQELIKTIQNDSTIIYRLSNHSVIFQNGDTLREQEFRNQLGFEAKQI